MGESTRVDPDEQLRGLGTTLDRLSERSPYERHELYHRLSLTSRVSREPGETEVELRTLDEGTALRVRDAEGRERFAAGSGGGQAVVDGLLLRCAAPGTGGAPAGRWPARAAPPRLDHDEAAIPIAAELRAWLQKALADLDSWCSSRRSRVAEAWIEASHTIESWAAEPGLRASRVRARGWAMARIVGQAPLFIASRDWRTLSTEGFRLLAGDRWADAESAREEPFGTRSLLVGPEAAATLVATLARVLHRPERRPFPVGPGWCLLDAPGRPNAIFGGRFDDVGISARTARLADGLSGTPAPERGRMRRSSYRDPPSPRMCHIEVAPSRRASGLDADRLATVVVPHALDRSEWLIELYGAQLDRGHPTRSFASMLRTDSETLARCCVAGVGPPRASHRGVVTPALLFEGLGDRSNETA